MWCKKNCHIKINDNGNVKCVNEKTFKMTQDI